MSKLYERFFDTFGWFCITLLSAFVLFIIIFGISQVFAKGEGSGMPARWHVTIVTENRLLKDAWNIAKTRDTYSHLLSGDNPGSQRLKSGRDWSCLATLWAQGAVVRVRCRRSGKGVVLLCEGMHPRALAHCFSARDDDDWIGIRAMELPGNTL